MSRLRVALDGRPLQVTPLGGVGRYLASTIPSMAKQAELLVLFDRRLPHPPVDLGRHAELVAISTPVKTPGLVWLELAVTPWLRRFGGIFHATFNTLPLTFSGRGVLTLHDLAPQLHPEDFRPSRRVAWRLYVRASVARAKVITTVSEFSKNEMVEHFQLDPNKVLVARSAVGHLFDPGRAKAAAGIARARGLPERYVVALGGAPRRDLPLAIDAWREVRQRLGIDLGLAVTGENGLTSERGLVSLGFPDDEEWATLLAGAEALCYPTRYEGFGLPALEAIASGTPVVSTPVASLPEVLGDAGCWASASSPSAIADVIIRLLEDADWQRERRESGVARARAASSWEAAAAVLLDAYTRAAA